MVLGISLLQSEKKEVQEKGDSSDDLLSYSFVLSFEWILNNIPFFFAFSLY